MGNHSQLEHAVPQCLLVHGVLSRTRKEQEDKAALQRRLRKRTGENHN